MRIGYLTVPPTMPDRDALRDEIFVAADRRRLRVPERAAPARAGRARAAVASTSARSSAGATDWSPALREMGYEATMPEGTFYTMARSPIADDVAFAEILAEHKVLVLPGTVVEVPGWFRISLTASDEMVERGIPRFAAAMEATDTRHPS